MKPEFLPGNRLTLLNSGGEFFPALLAAIAGAQREIHLETYIFADDATGRAVAAALAAAAQRGVSVRVLVDGFGGQDFPTTLMPALTAAGAQVLVYRFEFARFRLRRYRLRRLHRKIAVIDGETAFVGGINVIDDLNTPHQIPPRFDFAVRVEGPLLAPIQRAAHRIWEIVVWASFKRRFHLAGTGPVNAAPAGTALAAFVQRDNLGHRHDIERAYLAAIHAAEDEIVIASAYFLPGRRFRHALMAAAKRGVKVCVVLQGRVEYRLLHYATQALYGALLASGVRIFEYRRSFLHAKVAVVDRQWATVGSSNIDPFSLMLAREANVVARDREFAETLRASLATAISDGAHEVLPRHWRALPLPARVLRWGSYQLTRWLIGLAGYSHPR